MSKRSAALLIAAVSVAAVAQRLTAQSPRAAKSAGASSASDIDRAMAQLRRRVDVIDAENLAARSARLAGPTTRGETILTSGDYQTTFLLVHRTTSSQPEVHARWDDIVLVQSGASVIELGDSLVGSTLRAPGERIGGHFHVSQKVVAQPGDIIRIPAAVPHAFIVEPSHPVDYLVIKQRRQNLPIRWYVGQQKPTDHVP